MISFIQKIRIRDEEYELVGLLHRLMRSYKKEISNCGDLDSNLRQSMVCIMNKFKLRNIPINNSKFPCQLQTHQRADSTGFHLPLRCSCLHILNIFGTIVTKYEFGRTYVSRDAFFGYKNERNIFRT